MLRSLPADASDRASPDRLPAGITARHKRAGTTGAHFTEESPARLQPDPSSARSVFSLIGLQPGRPKIWLARASTWSGAKGLTI